MKQENNELKPSNEILNNLTISIEHIRKAVSQHQRLIITEVTSEVIRAAVLIPLLPINGELHILLTKRTEHVETHKGQISFPGGVYDTTDASLIETALRETEEEVGIHTSLIEVIGGLDDLLTPFNFCITPVVGYMSEPPPVTPNPAEVAEVFYVPISFFCDPQNGRKEILTRNGKTFPVWFFPFKQHIIWGATAGLIKKLVDLTTQHNELL